MQMAAWLVGALAAQGVWVPEEIGVVGYHDPPTALGSRPPLTTVRIPSHAQGRRAVERVLEMVDGTLCDFQGEVVGDAPEFVIRGSLASPG